MPPEPPYRFDVSKPRTVSVLFSDIVGSTELFAAMGDDAADAVRREHLDGLGRVVAEHGGRVVKGLGDGIMAVFDSAAGAVEAGVAMQASAVDLADRRSLALSIRVGVTAGDASAEGDDWFGTPVVESSRLCATAAPGQVLASDLVRSLAGTRTRLVFQPLGPRALKGLPAVVLVHEVRGASSGDRTASTVTRARGRTSVAVPRHRDLRRRVGWRADHRAPAGEPQGPPTPQAPGCQRAVVTSRWARSSTRCGRRRRR